MCKSLILCAVLCVSAVACGTIEDSAPADVQAEPIDTTVGCESIAAQCKKEVLGCTGATADAGAMCAQCPLGEYPEGDLAQCTAIPGTAIEHTFSDVTLKAGEERDGWGV